MNNIPGFGFLKILLSLGMIMNMTLLVGLTQKDMIVKAQRNIASDLHTMQEARATIVKLQPVIEEYNRQWVELNDGHESIMN